MMIFSCPFSQSKTGQTVLMHACQLARNDTAAMLIEKGADIEAVDEVSESATAGRNKIN
jgi:ankyrin repeat protein